MIDNSPRKQHQLDTNFYEFEKLISSFQYIVHNEELPNNKARLARYIAVHDSLKVQSATSVVLDLSEQSHCFMGDYSRTLLTQITRDVELQKNMTELKQLLKTKSSLISSSHCQITDTVFKSENFMSQANALADNISKRINLTHDHDALLNIIEDSALATKRQQYTLATALTVLFATGPFFIPSEDNALISTAHSILTMCAMLTSTYFFNIDMMNLIHHNGLKNLNVNPNFPVFKVLQMQLPYKTAVKISRSLQNPINREQQIQFSLADYAGQKPSWEKPEVQEWFKELLKRAVTTIGEKGVPRLVDETLNATLGEQLDPNLRFETKWIIFRLVTNLRLNQNETLKNTPKRQAIISTVLTSIADTHAIKEFLGVNSEIETDYFPEYFLRLISKHLFFTDNANAAKVENKAVYLDFIEACLPAMMTLASAFVNNSEFRDSVNFNSLTDKVIASLPSHNFRLDLIKTDPEVQGKLLTNIKSTCETLAEMNYNQVEKKLSM